MLIFNSPQRNRMMERWRAGVTLVEVLTSIIIATIGVAGVLVLIPFAVRQATTGLDLESGTGLAENAVAHFEIAGYNQVFRAGGSDLLPWIVNGELLDLRQANLVYFMDPLWYGSQTNVAASIASIFLPVGTPWDATLSPRFATLLNLNQPNDANNLLNPISLGAAARMFQHQDDLVFGVDETQDGLLLDGLSPPHPYFDRTGNEGDINLRRQFVGDLTWSGVVVGTPHVNRGNINPLARVEGFDFYVLVYKSRSFENPAEYANSNLNLDSSRDPRLRYAQLIPGAPNPDHIYGSGTIYLETPVQLQNDEWIMLINYDANLQAQVGIFRVIGSAGNAITIDGSEFALNPNTFAVHLPFVINVYKRQLVLEHNSLF